MIFLGLSQGVKIYALTPNGNLALFPHFVRLQIAKGNQWQESLRVPAETLACKVFDLDG